jgi:probable HAF family extracellular repeat protein
MEEIMPNRVIRSAFVIIALLGLGSPVLAAIPTICELGIANGSTASRGYLVNDSGQVAVTSTQLFGQGTASRYDGVAPGGTLRTLAPSGYAETVANAINSSGQVVGYTRASSTLPPIRAFRYDGTPGAGGILRDLGTLGGASMPAASSRNRQAYRCASPASYSVAGDAECLNRRIIRQRLG